MSSNFALEPTYKEKGRNKQKLRQDKKISVKKKETGEPEQRNKLFRPH